MLEVQLKAGSLAYFDSFAGMVKVKIISVTKAEEWTSGFVIEARVTSKHSEVYPHGEVISCHASRIVPRNIRRVRGSFQQKYITPDMIFVADSAA